MQESKQRIRISYLNHQESNWLAFLVFVFIIFCSAPGTHSSNEPRKEIVFTCFMNPGMDFFQYANTLYGEVFDRLGYDFRMIHAPMRRGMAQLVRGEADGLCAHNLTLTHRLPPDTATMVNTIIGQTSVTAWSHSPLETSENLMELFTQDYSLGYASDDEIAKTVVNAINNPKKHWGNGYQSAIDMLCAKRFDILFVSVSDLIPEKQRSSLFYIGPVLKINGYPYLHNRHVSLLPDFEKTLIDVLKKRGIYTVAPITAP